MAGSKRAVPDAAVAGGVGGVAAGAGHQAVGKGSKAGGKPARYTRGGKRVGRNTGSKGVKADGGETWAWWGWWLGKQESPDGEPRDGLREAAEGMAREIAERVPLGVEQLAVLDLICYRGLLRAVPKLRGLGVVVGRVEFARRLGMKNTAGLTAVLRWLADLGLVRPGRQIGCGNAPHEIPEAVVEVCLRLKEARGRNWWKDAPAPPKKAPRPLDIRPPEA